MSDDAELLNASIASARQGGERAWELLARYREILCNLAEQQFGSVLRPDWSASDLAHDTLLESPQGFAGFHGTTETGTLGLPQDHAHPQRDRPAASQEACAARGSPPPDSSGNPPDPPDPGTSPSSDAKEERTAGTFGRSHVAPAASSIGRP